jgi:type VI secretion system secreted protein VgrG
MALESDGARDGQAPTQAGHLLAIETTLGKDALLLTALDGVETVSRGFVYTIELLTRATETDVRKLIGQPVTLWLRNDSETDRRPLHGHVRRLTRLTTDIRGYYLWRAEVAPWLRFLTHSVDCRIYQNLTIPEILRSVFDEHGLIHHEFHLHGQYPKLDFCVQYRESAFAFVSRLIEHVGIFYWFEHYQDRHLLILGDNSTLTKFTTPQQVTLAARGDIGEIQELEPSYEFRAGNWALGDYDFEVPTKNLHTHERTVLDVDPMKRFEIFDYPGRYLVRDKGTQLTRLRMEQEEARHHRVSGAGSWTGLDPGKRFVLAQDRSDTAANEETYFLTEVQHSAREPSYFTTPEGPATYSNRFSAIPARTPFRPERLTPQPVVEGPQTATVVGPAGENIHTDQYGRVRVLFHWDRRGKRDEHASCWIRVSQNSAGSHWGALAIPHVGQEVIVAFLEGDPDRPIVTGHVHNGNNLPPLDLPQDKDKTILRDHGDNKVIMHGKAGQQWTSIVSPRSVNLIAKRSAAKPLSADITISGVTFDPYEDSSGYQELYNRLTELEGNTDPPPDDWRGDVSSLAEGRVNSLSGGNTNAWVGQDSNSWVKRNSNSYVNQDSNSTILGNSTTDITGTSTTTIGKAASATMASDNNSYVMGNNTQVIVGTNDSLIMGLVTSLLFGGSLTAVAGISIQMFLGLNSQLTAGLSQQWSPFNVQKFGINIQHNETNMSWDDVTIDYKSTEIQTSEFKLHNSALLLLT